MSERNNRKTAVGVVISDKMDKTITVQSEFKKQHPIYKKFVRHFTKYKVHDEKNEAREGDEVEIMSTRPLSKTKRWRLLRVVRKREE